MDSLKINKENPEFNEYQSKISSKSSLDTASSIEEQSKIKSECNSPSKISINDFKIIKTIGKGSYAKVVLAKNIKSQINFAVKIIDKDFIEREEKIDQIYIERQMLSKLSHQNIIKLYSTFHNKKKLYFVFELAERGDLKEFLNTTGNLTSNKRRP